MFCPDCGSADQEKNTYCRSCGEFLPDMKGKNRHGTPMTPLDQIKMSLTFNLMSAVAAFGAGIFLLISHLNREGTHYSVFIALSVLFVIGSWQIASFFNNYKLKSRFKKNAGNSETDDKKATEKSFTVNKTKELLPQADYEDFVPASVTESTTKNLKVSVKSKKSS
jgi:hypothetical protein